jgi:acyl-coenzyme A thioesterase PaaI-like protein
VRPITERTGPIRAEGRSLYVGRRSATAEGKIIDANGALLAHGITTCMIFEI